MRSTPHCDSSALLLDHHLLRDGFYALPPLVRAVAERDAHRAAAVATRATGLIEQLRLQHCRVDERLWPILRARRTIDPLTLDRLTAQHGRLHELTGRVDRLLPEWRAGADPVAGESLAARLDQLYVSLDEHLTDEQTHVLPIVSCALTSREWRGIVDPRRSLFRLSRLHHDTRSGFGPTP